MNVLPTIKELYTNEIAEKQDTFVALLNQEPKSEWIAEHPYIKQEVVVDGVKMRVPYKYIPINRVEFLCFNPCCAGCSSGRIRSYLPYYFLSEVSILVVLDVVLEVMPAIYL